MPFRIVYFDNTKDKHILGTHFPQICNPVHIYWKG